MPRHQGAGQPRKTLQSESKHLLHRLVHPRLPNDHLRAIAAKQYREGTRSSSISHDGISNSISANCLKRISRQPDPECGSIKPRTSPPTPYLQTNDDRVSATVHFITLLREVEDIGIRRRELIEARARSLVSRITTKDMLPGRSNKVVGWAAAFLLRDAYPKDFQFSPKVAKANGPRKVVAEAMRILAEPENRRALSHVLPVCSPQQTVERESRGYVRPGASPLRQW